MREYWAHGSRCRRWSVVAVVMCSALVVAPAGCGYVSESTATTAVPATVPPDAAGVSQTPLATSTTLPEPRAGATFDAVFQAMALAMAPVPVYGLVGLPTDAVLPAEWWPVIELGDPGDYEGERFPNPRVIGETSEEPQAQLVLGVEEGWLLVFENLRGDLGDVQGEPVGTVGGHRATLYEVNGGNLVQWSDGGRWYGVFGREVSPDRLVELALSAELVRPKDSGPAD